MTKNEAGDDFTKAIRDTVQQWLVRNPKVTDADRVRMGIIGSNGMCAGNSPAEAIFQGICELLERYSTNLIYNNQLTPPTIPKDILKKIQQTIYSN